MSLVAEHLAVPGREGIRNEQERIRDWQWNLDAVHLDTEYLGKEFLGVVCSHTGHTGYIHRSNPSFAFPALPEFFCRIPFLAWA